MTRKRWNFPKYESLLALIVSILFIVNYKAGTHLIGWDSLSTELNPILAVKRALFAVWQEYQSFGLVSGMAHASDLIRAIFVWILSFMMPQNMIRYFVHFFLLFVGAVGMFRLLNLTWDVRNEKCDTDNLNSGTFEVRNEKIPHQNNQEIKISNSKNSHFTHRTSISLLGSLFYMFFLPTIQIFYLPFEPFSWFFAALPWLIWIFIKTINNQPRSNRDQQSTISNNFFLFFLINLLATPAWYVQTLFVVYIMILGLIVIAQFISWRVARDGEPQIRRSVLASIIWGCRAAGPAVLLIFLINSFWLLPQLYFLKTSGAVVRNAKINQLATEDIYYLNREKGTPAHLAHGEGFYWDLIDMNRNPLFAPWQKHYQSPAGKASQYLIIGIILLGFFRKSRYRNSFLLVFLLVMTALLSNTFPFLQINGLIRKIDFVNQIFRSPFTKFAIPLSLVVSYFFTSGISLIYNKLQSSNFNLPKSIFPFLTSIILIFYAAPAFQGFFLSPSMKVAIPNEYRAIINYFKSEPKDKRIALLPDYTFWGWFFTRWHYDGSGFLWYAVEQPIVSRTFDVWSNSSESYYWEIKAAIEAEDADRFASILKKYDIDYLLLDRSLLPVSATYRGLAYERLENLLNQNGLFFKALQTDNLTIYKTSQPKNIKDFVSTTDTLTTVGPKTFVTNFDQAYQDLGNYQINDNPDYFYPFADLTTQTRLKEKNWEISENSDKFILKASLPTNLSQYQVVLPTTDEKTRFFEDGQVATYSAQISAKVENDKLVVEIAKDKILDFAPRETKIQDCSFERSPSKKGQVSIKKNFRSLEIENQAGKISCFAYDGPYLPHKYSYLVKIDNKNISGRRLFFYILDKTKRQSYIEDRLMSDTEYFIVNPKNEFGLGHSFVFHNNSYEEISSKNILEDVGVYLFPFEELKKIYLVKTSASQVPTPRINKSEVNKLNYFTYQIQLPTSSIHPPTSNLHPPIIVLNQSFSSGWHAYRIRNSELRIQNLVNTYFPFLFGKEVKDHFVVNGWANGWKVPVSTNPAGGGNQLEPIITIVFLPQLLEFAGFGLLAFTLIWIILIPSCFFVKSSLESKHE